MSARDRTARLEEPERTPALGVQRLRREVCDAKNKSP
jgi:hypothetical protein